MRRFLSYQDCLDKFIKVDSGLSLQDEVTNIIYCKLKDSDKVLGIFLLTIMNNQNKKNHISVHGYYAALVIELLLVLVKIVNEKNKYTVDMYDKIINKICQLVNKFLLENLDVIKEKMSLNKAIEQHIQFSQIINNSLYNKILIPKTYTLSNNKINSDISSWYLQNNEIKNIKQINKQQFVENLNNSIICVAQLAIKVGWMIGCGNNEDMHKIEKIGETFGWIYKLYIDYKFLDDDILKITNGKEQCSYNYLINYGIQDSYDIYLDKIEFATMMLMDLELYEDSKTIQQILMHIEETIDKIIENTSPDIKSSISSIASISTLN